MYNPYLTFIVYILVVNIEVYKISYLYINLGVLMNIIVLYFQG